MQIGELLIKYKDVQPQQYGENVERSYPVSIVIKMMNELKQALLQTHVMQGEARTVAAPSVEETINRLGECSEGNEYIVRPEAGQWWIVHKHIGSGEPFEQFLRGSYGA